MSVSSQVPYKKFIAAPGATVFSSDFRVILASDLEVRVDGVIITSGFTLAYVDAPNGVDVTFITPMAGGEVVELQRKVPLLRATDYQQLGNFQADVINRDLDRLWMAFQDSQFLSNLAILLPVGDALAPMTIPDAATRASQFLAFDAIGQAIAAVGASGVPVSAFMASLLDDLDAAAARTTLNALVNSIATGRLLGRTTAATGAVEQLTVGGNLRLASGALSGLSMPVRQTVLSGPVDTAGASAFGGATGTATLTAAGTLVATAAGGFNAFGINDRIGQITNPAWTSPAGSGTAYLSLAIAADGTCTPTVRSLAPAYRQGGADVVTNGQFTYNIQEMLAKVGNGATATQVFEVFVGRCAHTGGVWSGSPTWFALQGRSVTDGSPFGSGALQTISHNLGVSTFVDLKLAIVNVAADVGGWAVGDEVHNFHTYYDGTTFRLMAVNPLNDTQANVLTSAGPPAVPSKAAATFNVMTAFASWRPRVYARRSW